MWVQWVNLAEPNTVSRNSLPCTFRMKLGLGSPHDCSGMFPRLPASCPSFLVGVGLAEAEGPVGLRGREVRVWRRWLPGEPLWGHKSASPTPGWGEGLLFQPLI